MFSPGLCNTIRVEANVNTKTYNWEKNGTEKRAEAFGSQTKTGKNEDREKCRGERQTPKKKEITNRKLAGCSVKPKKTRKNKTRTVQRPASTKKKCRGARQTKKNKKKQNPESAEAGVKPNKTSKNET